MSSYEHLFPQARTLPEQMTDFTFEGAPPPCLAVVDVDPPAIIGREDWTALFNAVTEQLRLAVAVRPAGKSDQQLPDAGRVRARVLECVAALEKLQAARMDAPQAEECRRASRFPMSQGLS